jgi:Flp pilus assembly protein TadG
VSGRRWPGRDRGSFTAERDRGSFTAELAAGLPALTLLLLTGLTAVAAVDAKASCADAAREGALAAARGEAGGPAAARVAPRGAQIEIGGDGETATALVRAPVRVLGAHLPAITVRASAAAAREPDTTNGAT